MQLNDNEQKAIRTIQKHLFTAPYNLLIQDQKEQGPSLYDFKARIWSTGDNEARVIRFAHQKEGRPKTYAYVNTDFFTFIKDSAIASADNAAARIAIRGIIKVAGAKMKQAFKEASFEIANNLGEGESLLLVPDEETQSVVIGLYRFNSFVREIEKDFFLSKILGNEGTQKLISVMARFDL